MQLGPKCSSQTTRRENEQRVARDAPECHHRDPPCELYGPLTSMVRPGRRHRPGSIHFFIQSYLPLSCKLSPLCLKNSGSIGTAKVRSSGLRNMVRERKLTGSRSGNPTSSRSSCPGPQTCIDPLRIRTLPVFLEGKLFGFSCHHWLRAFWVTFLPACCDRVRVLIQLLISHVILTPDLLHSKLG